MTEIHRGKSYCIACKEKIAKCAVKDEYYLKEDMTHFEVQDIWVHEPDQNYVVKSCVSRKNLYKGSLYSGASEEKSIKTRDDDEGVALLEEFTRNGYVELHNSRYTKKKNSFNWAGKLYKTDTAVGEIIRGGKVISNYSNKPEPIFNKTVEKVKEFKTSKGEKSAIGIPYLGFELEMSVIPTHSGEPNEEGAYVDGIVQEDQKRKRNAAEEMLRFIVDNNMGELLYFKKDSSVLNGWEIVSHPSTLSFWKEMDFRKFFEKAAELGLQSHDTCGLHVHVSRDALTKKQWWTLMSMVSKNANKIIKMSRRNKEKLKFCKWANNAGLLNALAEGKNIFNVFPSQPNRESAINFQPKHTVEFRLFRSTHSAEELLASFSLVEALVMFARKYSFMYVQDARTSELWDEFVSFCDKQGYGTLVKYMEEVGLVNSKSKIKKRKVLCV